MDKYFICLANSYKRGGRCIAGIEILYNSPNNWSIIHREDGAPSWIRPIAHTTYGEIPNITASKINYFTIVKLSDVTPCPNEIHVEDVNYSRIEVCGQVRPSTDLLSSFVDNVHNTIFFNHGKAIPSDTTIPDAHSLMFIRPENTNTYTDNNWEKPKTRMKITHCGVTYDLPVTDPLFLDAYRANPNILQNAENIFLTLSLGLDYEGWRHKLVAAVFYNIPQTTTKEKTILKPTQSKWKVKEERSFTNEEIGAVLNAVIVANQYGKSVCFYMKAGGQSYIPLTHDSEIGVGENTDIADLKLLTLCKEGTDEIMRVRYSKRETITKSYMETQKQLHTNAYAKWTTEDDSILLQMYRAGASINELMEKFGRNEGSIKSRIAKLEANSAQHNDTSPIQITKDEEAPKPKSFIERLRRLFNKSS